MIATRRNRRTASGVREVLSSGKQPEPIELDVDDHVNINEAARKVKAVGCLCLKCRLDTSVPILTSYVDFSGDLQSRDNHNRESCFLPARASVSGAP